ncbi:hypothetical protein [Actinokineospora spheciospongiae]|uniref:hypothetical protein n=1 Tax=Actinokineospora spheciospongiae TaxID=909613 RepID=UPI0012691CCE|nr:hypothetical protein [Actinokineospora spheciospongiae]
MFTRLASSEVCWSTRLYGNQAPMKFAANSAAVALSRAGSVIASPTSSGKVSMNILMFAITHAADASGLSRREVRLAVRSELFDRTRFVTHANTSSDFQSKLLVGAVGDWDHDGPGHGHHGLSLEWLAARECARSAIVTPPSSHALFHAGARAVRRWLFIFVDPMVALREFLQRLVHFGRRSDVSRQLAVQRLKLMCRSVRSSPDVPPGEVVVASPCVPRGPDMSRVVSALVSTIRGDRFALT